LRARIEKIGIPFIWSDEILVKNHGEIAKEADLGNAIKTERERERERERGGREGGRSRLLGRARIVFPLQRSIRGCFSVRGAQAYGVTRGNIIRDGALSCLLGRYLRVLPLVPPPLLPISVNEFRIVPFLNLAACE